MNVTARIAVPITGWYRPTVVLWEDYWRSGRGHMPQAENLKVVLQQNRLEKRAEAFVRNAEGPLEPGEQRSLRRLGPVVGHDAVRHVQQDAQPLIHGQEGSGFGQEIVGLMGLDIPHRAVEQGPVAGPDLNEVGGDLAAEGRYQPSHL